MFLANLKNITTFIFDVDGVLTDGTAMASESGDLLRTFNIKDG
jgi:3-deoxy-D-manno-octulosonate 8-phosphate phosphatase (KDO 8-P phosphatase)